MEWNSCEGFATRSDISNKTIVTIAFVNDFVQDERVSGELFRRVALYRCNVIG